MGDLQNRLRTSLNRRDSDNGHSRGAPEAKIVFEPSWLLQHHALEQGDLG
jgi:hypothetical protein